MIIAGASRHAIEVFDLLVQQDMSDFVFFDNINLENSIFVNRQILHYEEEVKNYFKSDRRFILALGSPKGRYVLANLLCQYGGELTSIISNSAIIGSYNVNFSKGINVMNFAMISSNTSVGEGSLVNSYVGIHHDVMVGKYCEISPRATLLGGVNVGNFTMIGAAATILPNVRVGENVIIGAGAVVNRDVASNSMVVGIPARKIKDLEPITHN